MKSLAIDWTKDVQGEQKKAKEEAIRNSTVALSRLKELIEANQEELSLDDYKIPDIIDTSYGLRQAHRNGQRLANKRILDLLSFLDP